MNVEKMLFAGNRETGISGMNPLTAGSMQQERMKYLIRELYPAMKTTTIPPALWDTRPMSARKIKRALKRRERKERIKQSE